MTRETGGKRLKVRHLQKGRGREGERGTQASVILILEKDDQKRRQGAGQLWPGHAQSMASWVLLKDSVALRKEWRNWIQENEINQFS